MGDEWTVGKPTRRDIERRLGEARERAHEALAHANRLYTTASQAVSEQAFAEHQARLDEIARLEQELADVDKPPEPLEDILAELGPESEHAAMMAGIGGSYGQTSEQVLEESRRRSRRTIVALAASGSLLALAILAWLAWQQSQQGVAVASPTAHPSAIVSPGPTPTASATASLSASPRPSPSPTVSPSATPGGIGSVAVLDFAREGGVCALVETFTARFALESLGGVLDLTQLPEEHVTVGTLTLTTLGGGMFSTIGQGSNAGQTYDGTINGTTISGTHVYTAQGCNDTYSFTGRLYAPFLAPPPLGTPPAGFNFFDPRGPSRELPIGIPARISILGFQGGYVVQDRLPFRLVLSVGDEMPWDFMINGEPPGGCIDASECYDETPTFAEAAWFAPGQQPVLIAYDASGLLVAVYAPNGIPPGFAPLGP